MEKGSIVWCVRSGTYRQGCTPLVFYFCWFVEIFHWKKVRVFWIFEQSYYSVIVQYSHQLFPVYPKYLQLLTHLHPETGLQPSLWVSSPSILNFKYYRKKTPLEAYNRGSGLDLCQRWKDVIDSICRGALLAFLRVRILKVILFILSVFRLPQKPSRECLKKRDINIIIRLSSGRSDYSWSRPAWYSS